MGEQLAARGRLGQALMRFLGIVNPPEMPIRTSLSPTLQFNVPMPGMVAVPQRETWLVAGRIAAFAAANADLRIWAATSTFASADSREAAGIWILHWQARISGGGSWSAAEEVRVGVATTPLADPGPGLAAGTVRINPVGGTNLTAGASAALDIGNNRSPRAQVNMRTTGAFDASLVAYLVKRGSAATIFTEVPSDFPFVPMYVPPGHVFQITSTTVNEDVDFVVYYVEAEEPPVLPVFPF